MACPKATISRKPETTGPYCMVGGGYIVNVPIVSRTNGGQSIGDENGRLAIDVGCDELTATMICDAINEKIDRDFNNGGG